MANDYTSYDNLLSLVEEMFDIHSLNVESGVHEFSAPDMDFHDLKKLVCNKILQLMLDIDQNQEMSSGDKFVAVTSSMAYLSAENFVLWYEIMKNRVN